MTIDCWYGLAGIASCATFSFLFLTQRLHRNASWLFEIVSVTYVEVFLCSNLKGDLSKLNLVLNSFSVNPIYFSWLFEVVSVTVALYIQHI